MKDIPNNPNKLRTNIKKMFGPEAPAPFQSLLPAIEADKKKSIARLRPWSWFIELTHGCNLACAFCAARLIGKNVEFMSFETWKQAIDIIAEVSPVCRIDMANLGEPTMNPDIYKMFAYAREKAPGVQTLMYTNGLKLINGSVTYRELFNSGLNMIFVDMYHPKEKHLKLAVESGVHVIEEDNPKDTDINIFEHHGDPNIHAIRLSRNPGEWLPKKRRRWQTWLNNLDWRVAEKIGMTPVVTAPERRCDQPFKYCNIYHDGSYALCCQDGMREVAGTLGNVSSGVRGFFKFWLGEYMQGSRRLLDDKNRAAHPLCKRCKMADGRCDVPMWRDRDKINDKAPNPLLNHFWDGDKWVELEPYERRTK